MSSRAVAALLDRLESSDVECHSLVIARHGRIVAEGWWAPYTAERPHLLYSLTKSFTSTAVGLAVGDGLLSLDDRLVDLLPEHVPQDLPAQAARLTVHHLLTMTTGHAEDTLTEAWLREPDDLTKGFLRLPFAVPEGTRHVYDNTTTYLLARIVERVTGRGLDAFLDARLFRPMGIGPAEWDRVKSGAVFGFHGLHLRTEAVAAFGQLLLQGGRWGDEQLVPRAWVERATRRHIDCTWNLEGTDQADFACGYGYQFWRSRHGFHGHGAFGQQCVVVPSHDLVLAVTAEGESQEVFDAVWDLLLPGVGHADGPEDDAALAERLRRLALPPVPGAGADGPGRTVTGVLDASAQDSALPDGTKVHVEPVGGGWLLRFPSLFDVEAGHGTWRESSPLGRPVVASGAWQGDTFVAELRVITSPHRVTLVVDAATGTARATWSAAPLTTSRLERHVRAPLMTRPDVA
ncbi:serine hydrolase [Streptomyces sp. SID5785]|nr:serine hydrolase [Streptomyces sp. SID5785]